MKISKNQYIILGIIAGPIFTASSSGLPGFVVGLIVLNILLGIVVTKRDKIFFQNLLAFNGAYFLSVGALIIILSIYFRAGNFM